MRKKFWEKKVTWKKPDEDYTIAKPISEDPMNDIQVSIYEPISFEEKLAIRQADLQKCYQEADYERAVYLQKEVAELKQEILKEEYYERSKQFHISGTWAMYYGGMWTGITTINFYTMDKKQWENLYRTGFGGRHWQEYAVNREKRCIYVYTDKHNPEFPSDFPFIEETKEIVGSFDRGVVYEFSLVE